MSVINDSLNIYYPSYINIYYPSYINKINMPTCNPTPKKAINVKATNATSQIAILTSRYLLDLGCWLCSLCKSMPCNVIYDQWQPL